MRKLAALALASVLCLSGSAFAQGGQYYLQLAIGTAPLCGTQICSQVSCNLPGAAQFTTVFVTVIVDCHHEEGFRGVEYGLSNANSPFVISTGFGVCPNWLQGPGVVPSAMVVASTIGCQPCCTAVGNHSYLVVAAGAPVVWSLDPNAQTGNRAVIDCNLMLWQAFCAGQATLASPVPALCQCNGPTATEPSTWGNLKALYN
jgi:hypothetical protein